MLIKLFAHKRAYPEQITASLYPFLSGSSFWVREDLSCPFTLNIYDMDGEFKQVIEIDLESEEVSYLDLDLGRFYSAHFQTKIAISLPSSNSVLHLLIYPDGFFVGCKRVPDDPCDFVPLQNIEGVPAF